MEVRSLTETRTEEAKEQRKKHQKEGRDYCSRRGKVLVPRTDEVSNCVTATHGKEHLIMEDRTDEHTIAYSKSHRPDGSIDARGRIDSDANTLECGDGCRGQSTGTYVFTKEKDMEKPVILNPKMRNYKENKVCPAITASSYKEPPVTLDMDEKVESASEIRIRKLTPLECERLQGYPDNWTSKGMNDKGDVVEISNAQRYKMCGNGISATVPQTLFPAVFGDEPIRVMSLFSGCGGTELLLPDNFEVVGHCEFDKYASSVLRYHYPDIPNFHDVTEFADREDVPEFDMLVGGFPCPSWSTAGLRKGFDDLRGQLIFDVFNIIEKHKPAALALENVKGLLSHEKGRSFEVIMERLSELGYDLDFEVVNSKFFGLAQNRERVFIFGKLK